ncbi:MULTISPECIES: glycoside hydrolase family 1 protein [unclassified Rathayibacter]|uniref:glycoside hydrolase family 1 protein n=1 Tax=unclassified Rathayibacter TaxID=2609250 RepID=UPI00188BE2A0|nr:MULTISPECIES: family 1 glycosylhydrolase [unclassified Rathayibacter]MBF4462779.1 family 1 glycosylhydrolase [Rathayibacter sp. VKM Ac-2879]MBF4504193.1 family 1 glycosylhydrolase [Rathayibacter sp. VKM Ac-2878]
MREDDARGRDRQRVRAESARFDDPRELARLLPSGVRIGLAQSAFQTEGSLETGGRGRSVWDDFALRRGTIAEEATPEIATDFFLRWREDLALMVDLGIDEVRLSVSWTRLQPEGRGPIDRGGLGFYDRLLDALAEAGVRVALTLHHRDTPSALSGGWMRRDTALRFGDLAFELGSSLGDRVADWITLDQPSTVMIEGYALTRQAPAAGRLFSGLPALHHQLLGHGIAVEALRAAEVAGRVGIADALAPVEAASDSEHDRAWAALADVLRNRLVADAVLTGAYPSGPEELPPFLAPLADMDPVDLARISAPLDFYAVAPLAPQRIVAGRDPASPVGVGAPPALPFHTASWPEHDRTGDGSPFAPWAPVSVLRGLVERYGAAVPPLVLTALGASYPDEPDRQGAIVDTERIRWLGAHLGALAEAVHEGLPLDAVHVWTLVDAFEWQHGYTRPHGLVALDARSHDRVPKASFGWLRQVLDGRS